MKDFVKPTLVLALLAGFAGFLLAFVNSSTKNVIAGMEKEKSRLALSIALPGFNILEEKSFKDEKGEFFYHTAEINENGKTVKGYAFTAEGSGYSGILRTMVGFDENFVIRGICIMKQSETPGLGARCQEIASKYTFGDFITGNASNDETKPWFEKQFESLSLSKEIKVVKKGDWNESMKDSLVSANEVSAISGATVTTNAVRRSIEESFARMKANVEMLPSETVPAVDETNSAEAVQ